MAVADAAELEVIRLNLEQKHLEYRKAQEDYDAFAGPSSLPKLISLRRQKGILLPFKINVYKGSHLALTVWPPDPNIIINLNNEFPTDENNNLKINNNNNKIKKENKENKEIKENKIDNNITKDKLNKLTTQSPLVSPMKGVTSVKSVPNDNKTISSMTSVPMKGATIKPMDAASEMTFSPRTDNLVIFLINFYFFYVLIINNNS